MRDTIAARFLFIIISMTVPAITFAGKIKMKIIEDSANYGYFANSLSASTNQLQLVAKVKPANFSGPLLLKHLIGKCYNTTIDRYEYVLCPFQNMTQYETVPRWNAYQGVLGVWSHWKIENNSFVSMILTHGDTCGDVDRSVEVVMQCGKKNELLNVTEPNSCRYFATFTTRLLCHNDSFLVYPRLSTELQKKWDHLWTDYKMGYISEKGYNNSLAKIFSDSGLTRSLIEDSKKEEKKEKEHNDETSEVVNDLTNCKKEFEKLKGEMDQLKEQVESLKLLLDLNKVRNRTQKELFT